MRVPGLDPGIKPAHLRKITGSSPVMTLVRAVMAGLDPAI